jgi:hypothetical protein
VFYAIALLLVDARLDITVGSEEDMPRAALKIKKLLALGSALCLAAPGCTENRWSDADILSESLVVGEWTPSKLGTYFRDVESGSRIVVRVMPDGKFEALNLPIDDPSSPGLKNHQSDLSGSWSLQRRGASVDSIAWFLVLRSLDDRSPIALEVSKRGGRLWLSHTIDPSFKPITFWKRSLPDNR